MDGEGEQAVGSLERKSGDGRAQTLTTSSLFIVKLALASPVTSRIRATRSRSDQTDIAHSPPRTVLKRDETHSLEHDSLLQLEWMCWIASLNFRVNWHNSIAEHECSPRECRITHGGFWGFAKFVINYRRRP